MKELENIHQGDRLFIVATGPSLNETPLYELNNEYTMALGSINLMYDEVEWRPTYFVSWDFACEEYGVGDIERGTKIRKEYVNAHLDLDTTLILSKAAKKYYEDQSDIFYYNWERKPRKKRDKVIKNGGLNEIWSNDADEVVYNFGSTISVLPQIANYMGFDEIYFVGCDLFDDSRPYMIFKDGNDPHEFVNHDQTWKNFRDLILDGSAPIKSAINAASYKIYRSIPNKYKNDPNHFSDDYAPGTPTNKRERNKGLRKTHKVIKMASEKYEFDVYNATIGGYLEVYERVEINDVLKTER